MNNPELISIASLFVSVTSLIYTRVNNNSFASHQFINKQIDTIAELIQSLNNDVFSINAVPSLNITGGFSNWQRVTLFEIQEARIDSNNGVEWEDSSIYFNSSSNQLLNIKSFIDTPYLPKSIADELLNFYSSKLTEVRKEDLQNSRVIVLTTNYYEKGYIDSSISSSSQILKKSDSFALENWSNFTTCSYNLQLAIVKYLMIHKVKEINIRKDFKHLYLS